MLEVRKNTFAKNYENSFFREFSRHLYNSFKEKTLSGILIGSPLCEVDERLQIDALLITPNVVCIIDFKNFKGKVKLPAEKDFEVGLWTTETGEQIKGGNSINPFIQLKNQKRRFIEVSEKYIKKEIERADTFNPLHVVRVVCFQEEIEITGRIPDKEALNFFIIDKRNFIEKILDIVDVTDKDVNLSATSFDSFKKIFRADQYKFDDKPLEDKLKDVASKSVKLDYTKLYDDQKVALIEIKSFLENPEQKVFILQGTINSGKSFLIPFIQEIAYSSGIQETEIFAASSRVAKNLFSLNGFEKVNSIYSFIYGGQKGEVVEQGEVQEENLIEIEDQDVSDELSLEVVPMKRCDNSESSLFIVDESQLVSDSYYQAIDIVFGTGCLLRDFISFTDFNSSKRKIIFVGDPYQLQLGKVEESPLNPAYLEENYKLNVSCFQLLDKVDFSDINAQALKCVQSIRTNVFNSLRFATGNQISILGSEDQLSSVTKLIENNIDGHILSFSNEEAQKINHWIKKTIIKNGEDIVSRDLVLFNNNISIENELDPFAKPKKIYNGQFAQVMNASQNIIQETIKVKGEHVTINFREITLQLSETEHQVTVLSVENYRLNPKAELSKNEIIAFKVILNTQLFRYIKENPFEKSSNYLEIVTSSNYQVLQKEVEDLKEKLVNSEKVKGKLEEKEAELRKLLRKAKQKFKQKIETALRNDPSTKYYKYKNAALLRFGWAMTVHKAISYEWKEVLFNVDPGESISRSNANYYRWLYTGVSRARERVNLINFKPINPFDNTEFRDQDTGVRPQGIFYNSNNENQNLRLEELKEFVLLKLSEHHFEVRNVEHFNWQERYFIQNKTHQEAIISFSYNGQGNFRLPTVIGGDNDLSAKVVEILKAKIPMKSFEVVKDLWRRKVYEKLQTALIDFGINFELILQFNWKDKIRFFSTANVLEVELDYGGDGMVTFITVKYCDNITMWENFKIAIQKARQ